MCFILPIYFSVIVKICGHHLIIIIKSNYESFSNCLVLGHETILCVLLCSYKRDMLRSLSASMVTSWIGNAFRRTGHLWGGNHRSSVDSLHRGPVMRNFDVYLCCPTEKCWTNARAAGDLRHNDVHHVTLPKQEYKATTDIQMECEVLFRSIFKY